MALAAPRTIATYELREWDTRELGEHPLTAADRRLLAELASDGRVLSDDLRTGLRVRTRSWVGVVRLSSVEIRIMPKLLGPSTWLVAMLDFAGGVDTLQRLAQNQTVDASGDNLLELFTLLLCDAAQTLWDGGLLADYVEVEEDLPLVRGRILYDQQIRRRFGRLDRISCRYDERETDVAENQLVAAALEVAARRTRSLTLRHRTRRLADLFREQCSPEGLDLRAARGAFTYHRLNQHYAGAHQLAWLVLDGLGIRDLHASGRTDCFAFLFDMNALFEAFVDRLVRSLLTPEGAVIASQRKDRSVLRDVATAKPYASVIPDLLVSGIGPTRLPIDAKYKQYEGEKADRADIYQAFLYAMAYGTKTGPDARTLLLYPSSSDTVAVRRIAVHNEHFGATAEIRLCGIPVAKLLAEHPAGGPTTSVLRSSLLNACRTSA